MKDKDGNVTYVTIAIPIDIMDKVDEFIKNNKEGYRSRSEVFKTAWRMFEKVIKNGK